MIVILRHASETTGQPQGIVGVPKVVVQVDGHASQLPKTGEASCPSCLRELWGRGAGRKRTDTLEGQPQVRHGNPE